MAIINNYQWQTIEVNVLDSTWWITLAKSKCMCYQCGSQNFKVNLKISTITSMTRRQVEKLYSFNGAQFALIKPRYWPHGHRSGLNECVMLGSTNRYTNRLQLKTTIHWSASCTPTKLPVYWLRQHFRHENNI